MKVLYDEDVASHIGPESCGQAREGQTEALTGERAGRPLSRDSQQHRRADGVGPSGRQHGWERYSERPARLRVVVDPGMHGSSLFGNREISRSTAELCATVGGNSLANMQPFVRELGGRVHLFAHNGGLHGIEALFARSAHRFHPVGETDSEKGFCLLLDRLIKIWEGAMAPPLEARLAIVKAFAAEMRPLGIANFLYSDGEFVFGHGHRRTQADGVVRPPGLWVRHRRRHGGHHFAEGETVVVSAGKLIEREDRQH